VFDPTWDTPERLALRGTVRSFTQQAILPHLARWEEGALPRSLHRAAAAADLLGIGFPETAGGSGGDALDALVVAEEMILAGGSSGLIASLFTHGIGLPHLIAAGDQGLIERVARPVLAGEAIVALAITEPDAGSDVARLTTRAVRDGEDFLVTGSKLYITSGTRADFLTTAVRTGGDGAGGLSLVVIDAASPGVQVSAPLKKMGWWCSDTAELRFDEVRVPAANLVGPQDGGFLQIMRQFASERLSMAVQAHAIAQRCVDLTIRHAKQRESFGRPIATRQVVRHRIAEMARRTDVARTYTRAVIARWQAGDDVIREVAMAKNTAVAVCDAVVDDAVQLHGGMGYMRETEVERHYRDSRILGIGGGTNEIMTEVVSRLLLA
jgi:acyl-CoA dehydrogenase